MATAKLYHYVFEEYHTVRTRQRFLANQRVNLPGQGDASHDRKMVARQLLVNDRRLAFRSLGFHDARQPVDAGFVGKNQGSALPRCSPTQLGPHLHPPSRDGLLVTLERARDRNLGRPIQFLQPSGNVVLVLANPAFPCANRGDANTGPNVTTKSIRLRSVPEKLRDTMDLSRRQLGRMPRRRMGAQSNHAAVLCLVNPLTDGSRRNVQGVGAIRLSPTALFQVPGSEPSPLSPIMACPGRSRHTPILRAKKLRSLRSGQ